MSGLVNNELLDSLPTWVNKLVDKGFVVTYLEDDEGTIVLDMEREFMPLDWTLTIPNSDSENVTIQYEVVCGFDRLRDDHLREDAGLSFEDAKAIVLDLESELGKVFAEIKRLGCKSYFSHWQTDKLYGFFTIDVGTGEVDVDDLESIWLMICDYVERSEYVFDEYNLKV